MADRFDEIAHRVYLDVDARRAAKGTVRVRDLWRPIADALRDETADLRAKLARAEADRCPALQSTAIPESSDVVVACSVCGEERDEPHTWRECAEVLQKERVRLLDVSIGFERERDEAIAAKACAEADAAAMREAPTDDEVARIHAYAIDLCSGPTREQAQMIRDIVRRFVELRAESGAGAALLREVEQLRDLAGASGVEVDDIGRIVVVGVAPNERRHTVGREVSDALAEAVLARRHLDPEAATCEPPALLREVEAGRWLAEAADRVRLASSHKLGAALGDLVDALSDFHTARGAR